MNSKLLIQQKLYKKSVKSAKTILHVKDFIKLY